MTLIVYTSNAMVLMLNLQHFLHFHTARQLSWINCCHPHDTLHGKPYYLLQSLA